MFRFDSTGSNDVIAGLIKNRGIRPSDVAAVRKNYNIAASYSPKGKSDQQVYDFSVKSIIDWWKKNHSPTPPTPTPAPSTGGGAATPPTGSPATTQPQTYPALTSNLTNPTPVIQPQTYPALTSNLTNPLPVVSPSPTYWGNPYALPTSAIRTSYTRQAVRPY